VGRGPNKPLSFCLHVRFRRNRKASSTRPGAISCWGDVTRNDLRYQNPIGPLFWCRPKRRAGTGTKVKCAYWAPLRPGTTNRLRGRADLSGIPGRSGDVVQGPQGECSFTPHRRNPLADQGQTRAAPTHGHPTKYDLRSIESWGNGGRRRFPTRKACGLWDYRNVRGLALPRSSIVLAGPKPASHDLAAARATAAGSGSSSPLGRCPGIGRPIAERRARTANGPGGLLVVKRRGRR